MERQHARSDKGRSRMIRAFATALVLFTTAGAVPPHPSLLDRVRNGQTDLPYFATRLQEMHEKGICSGKHLFEDKDGRVQASAMTTAAASGPFRVLAILVQFSDHPGATAASFFDSLMFDSAGRTVADYYSEISYGQIDIVTVNLPSSLGWRTAPQTYAWYVNGQNGTGSYPQNSQKLTEDLVDQVDPIVNFANYDNDANGYVDVLVIVHSGTGAEYSGSSNDIWSHKWGITPRLKDGVYISDYTVQPEFWSAPGDMTIGVYSHELGHGFGLPDLYDVDYSSNGVGRWCIMSFGSWLGPTGFGESPAHPCAWSRTQMGFVSPLVVTTNISSQAISSVETGGQVFRLWNSGAIGSEYFLVENRQKTGYDAYLPGSGLLVWHIDESKTGNAQEWWPGQPNGSHYLVAAEQADGLFELEHKIDQGDAADPFPGSLGKTTFDAASSPNSDSYSAGTTLVRIDNISPSAGTMYADLVVGIAAGLEGKDEPSLPVGIQLSQNYPNPFNPVTTISFEVSGSTHATLEILNLLGQHVATLYNGPKVPGAESVIWDGKDTGGRDVPSGVYFYRLTSGDRQQVRKMILLR